MRFIKCPTRLQNTPFLQLNREHASALNGYLIDHGSMKKYLHTMEIENNTLCRDYEIEESSAQCQIEENKQLL